NYLAGNWTEVKAGAVLDFLNAHAYLLGESKATGVGLLFVRNDVRGGVLVTVSHMDVLAATDVTVTALEAAGIAATDKSVVESKATAGISISGVAVTNTVTSGAQVLVLDSRLTATGGGLRVTADNESAIQATLSSAVQSAEVSVGVVLAFNSVGWDGQNILKNFVKAITGVSLGSSRPVQAEVVILRSALVAGGAVSVTATNDAWIDATIAASAVTMNVTPTGDESKSAVSIAPVIAMNRVSTRTHAAILCGDLGSATCPTGAPALTRPVDVRAGGSFTLAADNSARITSKVTASSMAIVGSLDKKALAVTIGLAIARNEIANATDAELRGVVVSAVGPISVSTSDAARIDALVTAMALGLAAGMDGGTSVGGGGAIAVNLIGG
ncbi:MAG TPA: hypothetical protein PLA46_13740, partial [Phycicoccus sp.]|nr:hypothetical protein [Phycicoccus sp.]